MDVEKYSAVPKQFVLCFDGTGNKFHGDESDSNVLKIFRMLDRSKSHQFHYYQPGIGTYVTSKSLSTTGRFQRIRSAYLKAKDSAVGSSFADHVMGGYKFLMRYYSPGDEIYFIGFSRGSYIARFLAEMLDFIGLLEAGNEELVRFAWKTFAKWQQRRGGDEEDEEKKRLFKYMKAFRETFSRPITRIKFMGLFDTVNSVPAFESAWMQRSKFPYTARSSARVIRHAVGIDERRAKFRQDLISEAKPWVGKKNSHHGWGRHLHHGLPHFHGDEEKQEDVPAIVLNDGGEENTEKKDGASIRPGRDGTESVYRSMRSSHESLHRASDRYRAHTHNVTQPRRISLAVPMLIGSTEDLTSLKSGKSCHSLHVPGPMGDLGEDSDYEDEGRQDIQEVWFPGGHADIGGGWKLDKEKEDWPLSHAPLVWMVQEAIRAGLQFDESKLKQFECCEEFEGEYSPIHTTTPWNRSNGLCADPEHDQLTGQTHVKPNLGEVDKKQSSRASENFHVALHSSSTGGLIHDCLSFKNGLPALSVLSWRIMEYLPFRRMDLQDGTWKPIRWPLPCGETRDIPFDAVVHISALRRMDANPSYRPGNLIVGGGGRGCRQAPEDLGKGDWVVHDFKGDPVREVYVRRKASKMCQDEEHH
ncbi:hypothetical protein FE257_012433 [Aspergillus nanangensis]|uniref:T6SS Phospholipase effector Tle1-like catalytic domain-containing protein n=1 Tax=Aspergillus nanangensis TaxID=2582783 RepID=A0AAD4GXJ1_ASPNN|nr:hypothetical protein FE257_012433 [Aspergillus nanangensis]